MNLEIRAQQAKKISKTLPSLTPEERNLALKNIKEALENNKEKIIQENQKDLANAKIEKIPEPLIKRLKFDEKKIDSVIEGIEDLIKTEDILFKPSLKTKLAENLILERVSVPIGVLGIVFESRPDAFVQIASLALKSGNALLLKGGREAENTNQILFEIINEAAGLPEGWITNLKSREDVTSLLALDDYIDLIIPRGSNEFVKYIKENTKIPVLGHADGICHTYISENADLNKALSIADDGKRQYPAVCNATETILVDKKIAPEFLPKLKARFDQNPKTKIFGDNLTRQIINVDEVLNNNYHQEFLDYKVNVKVVKDINEAIEHINKFGSGHTDSIVSEDKMEQELFQRSIDSACVFVNCSTRFSDGFRFGFGAEVGISTNKLHARGPVGIEGLTTYKYLLNGNGQIVDNFEKKFDHYLHERIL